MTNNCMPKAQAPPLVDQFESWEIAAVAQHPYQVFFDDYSDEEQEEQEEEAAPQEQ